MTNVPRTKFFEVTPSLKSVFDSTNQPFSLFSSAIEPSDKQVARDDEDDDDDDEEAEGAGEMLKAILWCFPDDSNASFTPPTWSRYDCLVGVLNSWRQSPTVSSILETKQFCVFLPTETRQDSLVLSCPCQRCELELYVT